MVVTPTPISTQAAVVAQVVIVQALAVKTLAVVQVLRIRCQWHRGRLTQLRLVVAAVAGQTARILPLVLLLQLVEVGVEARQQLARKVQAAVAHPIRLAQAQRPQIKARTAVLADSQGAYM